MTMKKFNIFGDIVADGFKMTESDVCLQDFKKFLDTVEDGDRIVIDVCSCGGDVFQGIAISNLIKQYQTIHNCHFTAHIISIAASIASVICSACDEIELDSNALFMMHLPYTCNVTGNAIDLEKQIEQLNQCKKALISFYKTKFDLTEEEIEQLLIAETWIDADHISEYKLNCKVIETTEPIKIAASIKKSLQKFNNKSIIERFKSMEKQEINEIKEELEEVTVEEKDETVKAEETVEQLEEVKAEEVVIVEEDETKETTDDTTEDIVEETIEETIEETKLSYEELEKKVEELTAQLEEAEKKLCEIEVDEDVEKRVSGMQSKMQNKINVLTKEFKSKLEVAEKELLEARNQVSTLSEKLDTATEEFSELKSAFVEKEQALAKLNASVLKPNEKSATDWKSLKGKEFMNWLEANRDKIKNKQI